jgi:Na+/proline symporter
MSTSDAQMVVSSGLFTENIYRRFLFRQRSQRHYLWVGRMAGLVIVALALVLQSTFTDVIDALRVIIKTPAAMGISLWFGIVWRRWTSAAVWVSTLAAVATWAAVAYFPAEIHAWALPDRMFSFDERGHVVKMADAWVNFSYLSAGVVSGILVSLITPRVKAEKLDHFYRLLHTPVTPGEQVAAPCTLPENPAPPTTKLFPWKDVEIQTPTLMGMGGFIGCWLFVAAIVWFTQYLARAL